MKPSLQIFGNNDFWYAAFKIFHPLQFQNDGKTQKAYIMRAHPLIIFHRLNNSCFHTQ